MNFNTLLNFKKEKNFKIINCDKNIGNAILSNELYLNEINNFLTNDDTYILLEENPLLYTINIINQRLSSLFINGHISKKMKKTLLLNLEVKKVNLGKFKLLAKLHKAKFSWRPIINCQNTPTQKICKLIDFILKPLVIKTETYLRDSQNLIQKAENMFFEKKPYLYSLDFESLYTNIKPEDATNAIADYMTDKLNNIHFDVIALRVCLELIFASNIFTCNGLYYKQIKGLAMGCACGPSVANLYVFILEKKWLTIHKPLMYNRFIDDIQMVLEHELNIEDFEKTFEYLKLSCTTGGIINFLDLNISYNEITSQLDFSVYVKPTNNFSYLRTNSNHPSYIYTNIIKTLFIRNRRICSNYYDYLEISKIMIDQLEKRGYDYYRLIKMCKIIGNIEREKLIPYKNKEDFLSNKNENYILFFMYYNFN